MLLMSTLNSKLCNWAHRAYPADPSWTNEFQTSGGPADVTSQSPRKVSQVASPTSSLISLYIFSALWRAFETASLPLGKAALPRSRLQGASSLGFLVGGSLDVHKS